MGSLTNISPIIFLVSLKTIGVVLPKTSVQLNKSNSATIKQVLIENKKKNINSFNILSKTGSCPICS